MFVKKTELRAFALVFLLILSMALAGAPRASAAGNPGIVTGSVVNLRDKPSMSGKVLTTVKIDSGVTVTGREGEWYTVTYASYTGYMHSDYIAIVEPDTEEPVYASGIVSADKINVRSSAALSDENIIGSVKNGAEVQLTGKVYGDWLGIVYNGGEAFVFAEYVELVADIAEDKPPKAAAPADKSGDASGETGIVTASAVNMREGSSTSYNIIKVLYSGKRVEILSHKDGWYKVSCDGSQGYVKDDYIRVLNIADLQSGDVGAKILEYSKTFLGVKYVYGGASPSGFDCSGLVQYVYAAYGYSLPRTATDQSKCGVKISKSELKPGDLVFFKTPGSSKPVGHVGIYAGNGKFLHAPRTGDVVKLTDLNSSYYLTNYLHAVRIV